MRSVWITSTTYTINSNCDILSQCLFFSQVILYLCNCVFIYCCALCICSGCVYTVWLYIQDFFLLWRTYYTIYPYSTPYTPHCQHFSIVNTYFNFFTIDRNGQFMVVSWLFHRNSGVRHLQGRWGLSSFFWSPSMGDHGMRS